MSRDVTIGRGGVILGLQVELGEDGPGHDSVGTQRCLDGAVQHLLEASGPQLSGVRVPHGLRGTQRQEEDERDNEFIPFSQTTGLTHQ